MLESICGILEKIAEIGLSQSRQPATENTLIQGPMPRKIVPKHKIAPKPQTTPENKPTVVPKKNKQDQTKVVKESPITNSDPKVQNQINNLEKKKYMLDKILVKKEQTKNTIEENAFKRNKNKEQKETPNTTGINNILEGLARKKNQIDKRVVMLQRKSNLSSTLRDIAQSIQGI